MRPDPLRRRSHAAPASADRMAPLPDRANPIGCLAIGDNRPGGREIVFIERDAGIEELAQHKHR